MGCGKKHGQPGAIHAIERAQFDLRSREERAGIAGGNDGVRISALDEVDGAIHRTVLLAPDGLHWRIIHFDDLAGMNDLDAVVGNAELVQFRFDARLIANQIQVVNVAVVAECFHRPRNDVLGGKVPTHRIDGEFHAGKLTSGYRYDLTTLVIAAGRTHAVGPHPRTTLGTHRQLRWRLWTVRRLASAQAHLGHSTFRDAHKKWSPLLQFQFQVIQRVPPQIALRRLASARTLI